MPLWIVSTRRQRHRDPLEPAAFELALHAQRAALDLHFHDDRRVRQAEPLGEDDAGLRVALVVGLQAGEHQVERLVLHRRGERVGDDERVGARRARRPRRGSRGRRRAPAPRGCTCATRAGPAEQTTTSPPCFSLQPQRLLERVGVGLVHLVAGVLLADPRLRRRSRRGCHSRVGTCLMQTAIFMVDRDRRNHAGLNVRTPSAVTFIRSS